MSNLSESTQQVLSDLITLVPPPERPKEVPTDDVWRKQESQLGTALPSDFKMLVERYGTGRFGDLIWVMNPSAKSEFLRVHWWLHEARETERVMKLQSEYRPPPYGWWPESPGLIPAAGTDNGDDFYWLAEEGVHPDAWRVAVRGSRDRTPLLFDRPFVAILLGILSGSLRLDALPCGLPANFAQIA